MSDVQNEILEKIKELQASSDGRIEARELCFQELSKSPHYDRVRIALARLYYLDRYYDFSLDILLSMRSRISSPLLDSLIVHLGGSLCDEDKILAQMSIRSK